jgi:hypothetical protein
MAPIGHSRYNETIDSTLVEATRQIISDVRFSDNEMCSFRRNIVKVHVFMAINA